MNRYFLAAALSGAVLIPTQLLASPPENRAPAAKAEDSLPPVFEALKRKERGEPTPPLPSSMARYGKAFDYAGKLGGLDVWSISGGPVFVVAPDGKTVVMGLAIAPDGRDETPDFTGAGSVDVEAFMRAAAGERERAERGREAARLTRRPDAPLQKSNAGAQAGGYDPAKAAAALTEMLKSAGPDASDPRLKALLEEVLKNGADPRKNQLAKTEEARAGKVEADPAPAPRGDGPAQAVSVAPPAVSSSAKTEPMEAPRSAESPNKDKESKDKKDKAASTPPVLPPLAVEPTSPDDTKALRAALESVAWRTSWIVIGNRDPKTPVIYVFADPVCPHCIAGFGRLRDIVDQGKLQLRVALTPYLSQESLDLATAVLRADDPGAAFWKLETERAAHNRNGIAPLPAKTWLDPERLAALDRNVKWFSEHSLAGTPFYLWREASGVRVLYGEPDVRSFYGALPDDVIGAEGEWRPTPEKKPSAEPAKTQPNEPAELPAPAGNGQ